MIKNSKKQINLVEGFTLIETMIAVFILTFTISSMMAIVASNLFAARYAKDEATANYLLQEVVDYIRNDRDSTVFLDGGATPTSVLWTNFYNKYNRCSSSSRGCYFDVLNGTSPTRCSYSGCPYLYYDPDADTTPFYVMTSGSGEAQSIFRRKIVVTVNGANPDQLDITVTVDWKNGGLPVSRTLEASLINWQ